MSVYFRVDEPGILAKIGHDPKICCNAAFVFDAPLNMEPTDLLELTDGAIYLITQGERIAIPGKWDR